MRILFIGDMVGRSGRDRAFSTGCPGWSPSGSSTSSWSTARTRPAASASPSRSISEFVDAGADAITVGNHAWISARRWCSSPARRACCARSTIRPARRARGAAMIDAKNGARVLVMNVHGPRLHGCAGRSRSPRSSRELAACALGSAADAIVIDIHAETTSEKQAMGFFADGRASLVVGTHTHVPTSTSGSSSQRHRLHVRRRNDRRLQLGDRHDKARSRSAASSARSRPASSSRRADPRRSAAIAVETDDTTGLATRVFAVRLGPRLEEARPAFWA